MSEYDYNIVVDTVSEQIERGNSTMPKGSPELTQARKDEIVNACERLYQTMSFKEITLKDIGRRLLQGHPSTIISTRRKRSFWPF